MSATFLVRGVKTVDTTLACLFIVVHVQQLRSPVVSSDLHDRLASLERRVQLTRCFSAVAELIVFSFTRLQLFSVKYFSEINA